MEERKRQKQLRRLETQRKKKEAEEKKKKQEIERAKKKAQIRENIKRNAEEMQQQVCVAYMCRHNTFCFCGQRIPKFQLSQSVCQDNYVT